MELQTAIEILEYHQEWRLGKREDMIYEPKKLTEAFDIVLREVKKFRLGAVSGAVCENEFCENGKVFWYNKYYDCKVCNGKQTER